MKNPMIISVKKPCTEKFKNFIKTARGGFCDSCQEEVIDFTSMSPIELQLHFSTTTTKEVIVALLKKFHIIDHPRKFAMYEQDFDGHKIG